ncbi:MAG: hypothetical protein LBV34_01160 [Nocardiopsaceae bacterium]|jgi:hypothetical protein|nr:hypothetical protein [Nocardiopsaceae bacterium]
MSPETIASLTTAGGTLVLAFATFSATRSANRAARIAERSLLASLRPVLVHAQLGDPRQKIGFADDHWVHLDGPQAIFDVTDDAIYFAFGLRNVGSGIGIIQAWYPHPERLLAADDLQPIEAFRPQTRALYVPPGGLGFWQGALRSHDEPGYAGFEKAAEERQPITIDLLYSDLNGGQRTITRMAVLPSPAGADAGAEDQEKQGRWITAIGTHWQIDDYSPSDSPAGLVAQRSSR